MEKIPTKTSRLKQFNLKKNKKKKICVNIFYDECQM